MSDQPTEMPKNPEAKIDVPPTAKMSAAVGDTDKLDKPEDLESDPRELLKKRFFKWLNTRFGIGLAALVLVPAFLWFGWDKVEKLPGVSSVVEKLKDFAPLPHATGNKFSLVIGKLENDSDDSHRRVIREALARQTGVEVLLVDRIISLDANANQQDAIRAGHERARDILKKTHADVMLWGTSLDAKRAESPMSLHWTTTTRTDFKSIENYRPREADYDLPELFWQDVSDVLGLLATAAASEFNKQGGHYVADQLKPFIDRVRSLLHSNKLRSGNDAALWVILADVLNTYGEQRGEADSLNEAVAAYREALKERTQDHVPLQWAGTQNNLGTALSTLGERESGTGRLNEAVAAYREALKEYTQDRVPLDWAMTQNNLGTALWTLGEREESSEKLEFAIKSFTLALATYQSAQVERDLSSIETAIAKAKQRLAELKSPKGTR